MRSAANTMTNLLIGITTIFTTLILIFICLKITTWKNLTKLEQGEERCLNCGEPIGRGCACTYGQKPSRFFVNFDIGETINAFWINLVFPIAWLAPLLVAPYSINSNKFLGFFAAAIICTLGIVGIINDGEFSDFFLDLMNDPYRIH